MGVTVLLKLGTRRSPLAMAQAEEAKARLCAAHGWQPEAIELWRENLKRAPDHLPYSAEVYRYFRDLEPVAIRSALIGHPSTLFRKKGAGEHTGRIRRDFKLFLCDKEGGARPTPTGPSCIFLAFGE